MSHSELTTRSTTGDSGPATAGPVRSGLAALLASVAGSVVAFVPLPEQVQVHWALGAGSYYGPESAPKLLVVALFPAIVAALALGAYWLGNRLETEGVSVANRREYRLAVAGTLASVLATQAIVILANVV